MNSKKWYQQSDIIMGIGAIFIVLMLVIPLPGIMLDMLIIISLGMGLIVLLTSMNVKEASDFSIFPNLLLILTLYRLALNVSTTRQILSKGPAVNSYVIDAFGSFIIGGGSGMGKYVVGFIIFIILTIVQMLVITKGASRISEVAARFTLDAMPGKQMAIDTDLSSGAINEEEARRRRKKLQREVDFYGSMDGASKFVQGDVRAGLIITVINLIGGLIIGMTIRGEGWMFALETYGRLTIGDGLVSQIPGLLTTTATGMIVTRAGSENALSTDFKNQLFKNYKTLYIVSGTLGLSSLIPGLPFIPLLLLSAGLAFLAYTEEKNDKEVLADIEKKEARKETNAPPNYYKDLETDTMSLDIGYKLLHLVEKDHGSHLIQAISAIRKEFAKDYGLVIPAISIRDNLDLSPEDYHIKLHGAVVGESKVRPDKLLAMYTGAGEAKETLNGEEFIEPSYGKRVYWIDPDDRRDAEQKGYSIFEPVMILITHLKEIIRSNMPDLLGREEIHKLFEHIKKTESMRNLASEVENNKNVPLGLIQQVLQYFLREGIGIKNLAGILESILNVTAKANQQLDAFFLYENARQAISRQLVSQYIDQDGRLHCITFDAKIQERMQKSIMSDAMEGRILSLPPDMHKKIIDSMASEIARFEGNNLFPVVYIGRELRLPLVNFLAKEFNPKRFSVVAVEEVSRTVRMAPLVIISVTSEANKQPAQTF